MKVVGNHEEWTVSQTQMAKILNLSRQRINQLIEEEIIIRDESSKSGAVFLIESVKHYYQSKQVDSASGVNFWKERGLHERAKREMAELKLAERRGELYAAETVERAMTNQLLTFKNKLLGLPSKYAAQLEMKKREAINDVLTQEIESLLEELSESYGAMSFEDAAGTDEGDAESIEAGEES